MGSDPEHTFPEFRARRSATPQFLPFGLNALQKALIFYHRPHMGATANVIHAVMRIDTEADHPSVHSGNIRPLFRLADELGYAAVSSTLWTLSSLIDFSACHK